MTHRSKLNFYISVDVSPQTGTINFPPVIYMGKDWNQKLLIDFIQHARTTWEDKHFERNKLDKVNKLSLHRVPFKQSNVSEFRFKTDKNCLWINSELLKTL